jgi:hypothetical protein
MVIEPSSAGLRRCLTRIFLLPVFKSAADCIDLCQRGSPFSLGAETLALDRAR